jgi:hypothetical protein
MKRTFYAFAGVLALCMFIALKPATAQFVYDTTGITGAQNSYSEFGDFDNDGDQDLILTGHYNDGVSDIYLAKIYRNTGGDFTEVYAGAITGVRYGAARWGDFDNDMDLDLFVTGAYGSTNTKVSKLYENTGSGFTEVYAGTFTALYNSHAAWADFNNDGLLDIILCGTDGSTYKTILYQNYGSGFSEVYAGTFPGMMDGFFAWADYDKDGLKDLACIGLLSSGACKSSIYHNTGTGFTEVYPDQIYDVNMGFCAWGDYNDDGLADLLVSGSNPDTMSVSRIYMNTGAGFTLVFKDSIAAMGNSSGGWGDLDNDGDLDIFISGVRQGGSRKTAVYINSGTGFHQMAGTPFTACGTGSASLVDYDNDHDLDIFYTGNSSTSSYNSLMYKNQVGTANTPPTAPANLSSSVVGNTVTLAWDMGTDNESVQDALTYNIYIGSTPASGNACSPMANLSNGYRRITAAGNTWQAYSGIDVSGLAIGTYYWSVQTIDNCYEGSAFATEHSFVISVGSVEEFAVKNTVLYPNPVTDASVVQFDVSVEGKIVLEVSDLSGRIVSHIDAGTCAPGAKSIALETSSLEKGMYVVRITHNGMAAGPSIKFMKTE